MRYLVSPDKFKRTLTAFEACESIANAIREIDAEADIDCVPIADGGEGTAEIIGVQLGAERVTLPTVDPLHRPITADCFVIGREAYVDAGDATGLWRVLPEDRAPLRASTFGTGLMLKQLVDRGITRVFLGLGGSATIDAGFGMAAGMGYRFFDSRNEVVTPVPENFFRISRAEPSGQVSLPELIGLADVDIELLGRTGAIFKFGPQKGLSHRQAFHLESELSRLIQRLWNQSGVQYLAAPGSGAAGGLGYGVLAFLGGQLVPGFSLVAERLALRKRIVKADIVITGEGKLDSQSLAGKAPVGIARLAREVGKAVWAVAGTIEENASVVAQFDRVESLVGGEITLERAFADPRAALSIAMKRLLTSSLRA